MELVSSRDKFPLFEKMILVLKKFIRSPSLLSPMWQKLSYICNNFFYYNNLSITFLNYRTIKKSPTMASRLIGHMTTYFICIGQHDTTRILSELCQLGTLARKGPLNIGSC